MFNSFIFFSGTVWQQNQLSDKYLLCIYAFSIIQYKESLQRLFIIDARKLFVFLFKAKQHIIIITFIIIIVITTTTPDNTDKFVHALYSHDIVHIILCTRDF